METSVLIQSAPKPYTGIRAIVPVLVTINFDDYAIRNEQISIDIIFPIISVWGKL